MICALASSLYDSGSYCAKKIKMTREGKGEIEVTVADRCPGCDGEGSVDLSVAAYNKLGTEDEGTFAISWYFES
ncbi:hypothetical protein JCM8097_002083 [Rhodosporidiobolus ruineniae]